METIEEDGRGAGARKHVHRRWHGRHEVGDEDERGEAWTMGTTTMKATKMGGAEKMRGMEDEVMGEESEVVASHATVVMGVICLRVWR